LFILLISSYKIQNEDHLINRDRNQRVIIIKIKFDVVFYIMQQVHCYICAKYKISNSSIEEAQLTCWGTKSLYSLLDYYANDI
jgi:hypothetical protein